MKPGRSTERIANAVRNQESVVTIESLSNEAFGVARVNGMVWFVANALPGEKMRARVIKPYKAFAIAKAMEILEESDARTVPPCSAYPRCGGCSSLHMKYAATLEYKHAGARDALTRIGGIADPCMPPVIGCDNMFRYRNKGAFPVGGTADNPLIGCFAARSHSIIVPENGCMLHPEAVNAVLGVIRGWMIERAVEPYDERTGTGLVRHIVTRVNRVGELLVTVVINSHEPEFAWSGELARALSNAVNLAGLSVSPNTNKGNVIFGKTCETIYGRQCVTETLRTPHGSIDVEVSPSSFFQVNTPQAERLIGLVLEFADVKQGDKVCDVYAGVGTFSLPFALAGADVTSIEIAPEAVADAIRNAERNGLRLDARAGDAAELLPVLARERGPFDCVTLDPPRKGCDAGVLESAAQAAPPRIVYVSCDPATLARDAAVLATLGYALVKAQTIDMFPWTNSIETVALFTGITA